MWTPREAGKTSPYFTAGKNGKQRGKKAERYDEWRRYLRTVQVRDTMVRRIVGTRFLEPSAKQFQSEGCYIKLGTRLGRTTTSKLCSLNSSR